MAFTPTKSTATGKFKYGTGTQGSKSFTGTIGEVDPTDATSARTLIVGYSGIVDGTLTGGSFSQIEEWTETA